MPIKAVQQFMLGTVMNSEQEALATMKKIKTAGYDGIELCAFMTSPTGFMVKMMTKAAGMPVGNGGKLNWQALVKEANLQVVALHYDLASIEREPDIALKKAEGFETKTIVITGMYRYDYSSLQQLQKLATRLNKAGETLAKSGIQLLYHNHNCEFLRVDKNIYGYDVLINETDERYVNFEFDSYWATDAGANAACIMQALGNRLKMYHINDRGSRQSGKCLTPILKTDSMELGTGSMDLASLINIAKKANVQAVILESHRNFIDKSPIKSLEVSAKLLNKHL